MEIAQERDDSDADNDFVRPAGILNVKATLVFLILGCVFLSVYEGAMRLRATDRYLALIVITMFLAGAAMAWVELRKWWKTRTERFGEPPLGNLLRFMPSPDKLRGRLQPSAQSLNQSTQAIGNVEPTKAA
jgi:hypothetical protein